MRRTLWVAAALLSLTAGYVTGALIAPQSARESYIKLALADACRLSIYDCSGVPAPRVFYSAVIDNDNSPRGVFLGGDMVVLRESLRPYDDAFDYAVLVHEIVHYLGVQSGAILPNNGRLALCISEEQAFGASNALLVEMGLNDRVVDWRPIYHC